MISNWFEYLRSHKNPLKGNDGFTLAELMIALGIMLLVLTGIINMFGSLNQTYTTQNVAASVQQVARASIDIMTRHIRMAGLNPLNKESIGILQAETDRIRFQYDTNGSGTIATYTGSKEDIGFFLNSNGKLMRQLRGDNATNESLVDNVTDLTFRYLDADDLETNELDAIRTVEVSLTVEEPAGRDKFISRTYATRVICRNLHLR